MKRHRKIELLVVVLVLGSLASLWFASEARWARINDPEGTFATLDEYLACDRPPSRVCRFERDGASYTVAYGSMDDRWLAVPSGPAAYVFDPDGKLIEWSPDVGDDPDFQTRWPEAEGVDVTAESLRR